MIESTMSDERKSGISPELFTCDAVEHFLRASCTELLNEINEQLEIAGLYIYPKGLDFSYKENEPQEIKTGHSCSVTVTAMDRSFNFSVSRYGLYGLSGNPLTDVSSIHLNLLISVAGGLNVRQDFGMRGPFGDCYVYGSDQFDLHAFTDYLVRSVVSFTLSPHLVEQESGDFTIVLRPSGTVTLLWRLSTWISGRKVSTLFLEDWLW